MNDIFDEIKRITPAELEYAGVIARAKKDANGYHTYICPFCKNGEGDSGDGLTVTLKHWGYNFHCFGKCGGKNYTAVDLIAEIFGFDAKSTAGRKETIERAKELFKLSDDFSFSSVLKDFDFDKAEPMSGQEVKTPKDYSEFYKTTQSQLAEFIEDNGGKIRGLSLEDLQEVNAGIATRADLNAVGEGVPVGSKCLILPNEKSFLIRNVINTSDVKVSRVNKGGVKTIYNPFDVDFSKAVFVVEGEIDVISINKAGYQSVALCSVSMWEKFIEYLYSLNLADKSKTKIVLTLDNDKAGQNAADKLLTALKSAGYSAVNFILSQEFKDANEYLQKDFEGFKERLKEISRRADVEFAQIDSLQQIEGVEILGNVFSVLDTLTEKRKRSSLRWGFPIMDRNLPLLPGNYILGALPSLGKTTFAINIASNICEQNTPVLYISYEPTVEQIAIKDLVRCWFLKLWNDHKSRISPHLVPSSVDVMLGRYSDNPNFNFSAMKKIRDELKEKRKNFYFLQGRNETAQELIKKIKVYVDRGVKFIIVDYIQLIKGSDSKKTVREQIDETIRALQIFQLENNFTILFISSFNRENYRNYACLESFKESGNLEYTADVIMALQLEFKSGESRTNSETFQKKKQATPRDMELVCLKNRFGIDFVDRFAYHSKHETFIEKADIKNNSAYDDFDKE